MNLCCKMSSSYQSGLPLEIKFDVKDEVNRNFLVLIRWRNVLSMHSECVVLINLVQLSLDGISPHSVVVEPVKPHGIIVVPRDFNSKLDLGSIVGLGCIDLLHHSDELHVSIHKSLESLPTSFIQ